MSPQFIYLASRVPEVVAAASAAGGFTPAAGAGMVAIDAVDGTVLK
jgi:hypothetical protein